MKAILLFMFIGLYSLFVEVKMTINPSDFHRIVLMNSAKFVNILPNNSLLVSYVNFTNILYDANYNYLNQVNLRNSSSITNIQITTPYLFVYYYTLNQTSILIYNINNQILLQTIVNPNFVWGHAYQNNNNINLVIISSQSIINRNYNKINNLNFTGLPVTSLSTFKYCTLGSQISILTQISCYTSTGQDNIVSFAHLDINNPSSIIQFILPLSRSLILYGTLISMQTYQYKNPYLIKQNLTHSYICRIFCVQFVLGYMISDFQVISSNQLYLFYDNSIYSGIIISFPFSLTFTPIYRFNFNITEIISVNLNKNTQQWIVYQFNSSSIYSTFNCSTTLKFDIITKACYTIIPCSILNCLSCSSTNICSSCSANYTNLNTTCALIANSSTRPNGTNHTTCLNGYLWNNISSTCEEINNNANSQPTTNTLSNNQWLYLLQDEKQIKTVIQQFTLTSQSLNSIPNLRNIVTFLPQLFSFFDQYWYYIYQRNDLENLKVMKIFLNVMNEVNQYRAVNVLFDTTIFHNMFDPNTNFTYRYVNYTDNNVLLIDQDVTYFQHNSRDLITFQYLFSFIVFISFILMFKICSSIKTSKNVIVPLSTEPKSKFKFNNKNKPIDQKSLPDQRISIETKILNGICQYFKEKSKLSFLILSIFQGNLIYLGFAAGAQMQLLFSFQFYNKISLILALVYGCMSIFFGFTFYLIIQTSFTDKKTKPKHTQSTDNLKQIKKQQRKAQEQFSQALNKTIFLGSKVILMGFIQSIFLKYNLFQLALLIIIKLIIISLIFTKSNLFNKKFFKYTTVVYFITACLIDVMLILSNTQILSIMIQNYQIQSQVFYTQIALMAMILLTVFSQVLIQIFYNICDLKKVVFTDQQIQNIGDNAKLQRKQKDSVNTNNIQTINNKLRTNQLYPKDNRRFNQKTQKSQNKLLSKLKFQGYYKKTQTMMLIYFGKKQQAQNEFKQIKYDKRTIINKNNPIQQKSDIQNDNQQRKVEQFKYFNKQTHNKNINKMQFENTKNTQFANTKNMQFKNTKKMEFANTKNIQFTYTKKINPQLLKTFNVQIIKKCNPLVLKDNVFDQ